MWVVNNAGGFRKSFGFATRPVEFFGFNDAGLQPTSE